MRSAVLAICLVPQRSSGARTAFVTIATVDGAAVGALAVISWTVEKLG